MIDIRKADPTSDALRAVVDAHFSHSETAGPAESNHTMDAESLAGPGIRFWAIYEGQQPLGCGALKMLPDGTAEVKSVHILAQARGRGLARLMMQHMADIARAEGIEALVLETGAAHLAEYDAARKLYEALGYSYCESIFGYEADPNSAFMRLPLEPCG
ncbi:MULTISPECIES: GNAT family N-acetyltransferase [unclassified Ruegeria]|uniref:GNAT family N-acetyltransferase n=1 Tax=unclassified Ruegeria TaxID=2625375 RepID=UPI001490EE8E|nr:MULTISPECIES: GNAT family N-acetyltransferase [unclassified Ruegeria]NOD47854.1 GNAT family N-acetyltransferase [Ruegeria sp. HKCCD5849]NOD52838.1 GNAT family N-acetyltransferase [Ruegeria sp. HKCCD5851]NOD68984.1 GNAT family N-acetyltransferase [Ruegeria sp. HKCCD7303]